jgi:tetraacyldisaccharide 4'-kinase
MLSQPPPDTRRSLQPLAWLYGIGVDFRNRLYDAHILKQTKYDIPVICVGNITVGGTGKTPHIEYLIELL